MCFFSKAPITVAFSQIREATDRVLTLPAL